MTAFPPVDPEMHEENVRIARAKIRKHKRLGLPISPASCRLDADYTTSYRDRLIWLEAARILEGGEA